MNFLKIKFCYHRGTTATKPRPVSNDDDIPKYAGEWPQLCQKVNVAGDHCTVHWYRGSKTTAWTPRKRIIPGTRGKQDPGMPARGITPKPGPRQYGN